MALLPSGTVTFLFTDVEDSTGLVQDLGDRYKELLAEHRSILRTAVSGASGREIDCRGEEFLFAFRRAKDAVVAAVAAQRSLAAHRWPDGREVLVRMGIHTGEPAVSDTGYLGLDVHRGARIGACGHGGQVLVSVTTRELVTGIEPPGVAFEDLGDHDLKGLRRPERLFQVVAPGLRSSFPRLRAAAEARAERRFLGRERELAHAAVAAFRRSVNVPRTPSSRRGFAELGWEVRALVPLAGPAADESLGRLAAELFTAARSVVHVDRYLGRLDERKLERKLAEYREMGVLSRRAREKADALVGQIATVGRLRDRRRSIDLVSEEVDSWVRARRIPELRDAASELSARLHEHTEALDGLAAELQAAIGWSAARLRRTLGRGVYRSGDRFVVPFYDEVGVEHIAEFDAFSSAREFRRRLRLERETRSSSAERQEVQRLQDNLSSFVPPTIGQKEGILPPRLPRRP
jgi:class 3 adenylate cyclase